MKHRAKTKIITLITAAAMLATSINPVFASDLSANVVSDNAGEEIRAEDTEEIIAPMDESVLTETVSGEDITIVGTGEDGQEVALSQNEPKNTLSADSVSRILTVATLSDNDASQKESVSENQVSQNVVSANKPNIHATQFSGVEPKIQMLNDGTYVAVKGQKIYMGIGGTSSDKKVISVDKKGVAKAKKTGSATLTYPDGTTLDVEVIDVKPGVKSAKLSVGQKTSISLNAGGAEAKGLKIAYQMSKPNVVQIDDGNVVAVAKGSVKVTATVGGKTYSTNIKVQDTPGSTLVLDAYIGTKGTKVPVKGTDTFTVAEAAEPDSNISEVESPKGLSSKQGLAVVKNKLTGYSKGKYTLSGNGREIIAYVDDSQPTNSSHVLLVGQPALLDVPEHSFIRWKSKNPMVAAVSEYGYIIGVSAGSTEIVGYANGKKMSAFNINVSEGDYKQPDLVRYTHEVTLIDAVNNNSEVKLWFDDFGHWTKNFNEANKVNNPVVPEFNPDPTPEPEVIPDNVVNFMSKDQDTVFKSVKVISGNLIAAADIPSIGDMPETDADTGDSIGYNPKEWYTDTVLSQKFDFATPITEPVVNLYPKYTHYHKIAFTLTTETNAGKAPVSINEIDRRLIEREGRVYDGGSIADVTCGIPTEADFNAFLRATELTRYWVFEKWLKTPGTTKINKDTVFSATMGATEHKDNQGLVYHIIPNSLDTADDDTANLIRVSDSEVLKAQERIDIPEDVEGAHLLRDDAKGIIDKALDEEYNEAAPAAINVYDNGWYYYQYSYYKHHDENDLRYVVNKQGNSVVLRADEERCINDPERHYYHIENVNHEGVLGDTHIIDTNRSEPAYLTPQLKNLGYVVALSANAIKVEGECYAPQKDDANTDFYLDRSRHTDAYRKIYKDRDTGFIFYVDDGEDLDSTEDDIAVIVINPGNGGNDDPSQIPDKVVVPGEPPQEITTGGVVIDDGEEEEEEDGKSKKQLVLSENGFRYLRYNEDDAHATIFNASTTGYVENDAVHYFHLENRLHDPWFESDEKGVVGHIIDNSASEIKYITPQLENTGYIVASRIEDIQVLGNVFKPAKYDDNTDFYIDTTKDTDAYRKIYKDQSTGFIFYIDDGEDPDSTDDDIAIIVLNPGNGGNDNPSEIPDKVTIPGEPPVKKPTGGITTPGEPPAIKKIGNENGFIYAIGESLTEILAFINPQVSLATTENKVADWNKDEFLETFGVSEDIIPRNTIWVGNADHEPTLGEAEVQNVPSEANITRIMEDAGQPVAVSKNKVTKDTVWYLHKGYGLENHPLSDNACEITPDGSEADVYSRVYKDESGYLFIIDDPTEDTVPNPHEDDRAVIIGFDKPVDGREMVITPDWVDDPRTSDGQPQIKVINGEPGRSEEDPDDSRKKDTEEYWTDPETGEKRKKHHCGDIVYILKDTDRDSVNEAVVTNILVPSAKTGVVIPELLYDDVDPGNADPSHQFETVQILSSAVEDMYPSATINVKSNKAPGEGVKPAIITGDVIFDGTAEDGTYIYRRYGTAGDIAYVVHSGQEAKVIGAISDRFAYHGDSVYVPYRTAMTVSGNQTELLISSDLGHSFDGNGDYHYDPNHTYYIQTDAPIFHNYLPSAQIVLGENEGVYHGDDRAPSGVDIYDSNKSGDYYWAPIGNNTYRQIHKLGQFYVAYADNNEDKIIGWYGLSPEGKKHGTELVFDVSLLDEQDVTRFNQGMIADTVFTDNPAALFSFWSSAQQKAASETTVERLIGVREENVGGTDRRINFINIYTKDNKRTYVRSQTDSVYEYAITWDEATSRIKAIITGLADPSHDAMAGADPELDGMSMYKQIKIPATIGGYPVVSVNGNALSKANDGKNVAEIQANVPLGEDIIKDTGAEYEIPASLAEYGISGVYTDGLSNTTNQSYSQTYKTMRFEITDADGNSTGEFVTYKYKHIHALRHDDMLQLTGEKTDAEDYAILVSADLSGLYQNRNDACYISIPKYVPNNTSDGAIVIAVDDSIKAQVQRKKNETGREIKFKTPLPSDGLPPWVDPETGGIVVNSTVTILVKGEREERFGTGFDPANALSETFRTNNSPDPSLDGKPGFVKEFNSARDESALNDQITEMDRILYKNSFNNGRGILVTAKEIGYVNPKLYEMEKDTETGEYRSTGMVLSVSGNTAIANDSVYELRFERDTYEITEIVKIVQAEGIQTLSMGTFKVKNGADLTHLGTATTGAKQYYSLQWFADDSMTTRFEDTEVTSSSPAVGEDGKRYIYGRLGGSRYNITLDPNENAGCTVNTSTKEDVSWTALDSWQMRDTMGTWGKAGSTGQDRKATIYGYYKEPLGYYYNQTLNKGTKTNRLPEADTVNDAPTMDHYNFQGWYTANGTRFTGNTLLEGDGEQEDGKLSSPSDSGITLYAKWEGKPYSLAYNINKGSGSTTPAAVASTTVPYGDKYSSVYSSGKLPVTSRTGYNFNGWYTNTSGGNKVADSSGAIVCADALSHMSETGTTLYAQWSAKGYTVTLNGNGGSNKTAQTVYFDGKYGSLPNSSRTGYTFAGWYTAASGGSKITSNSTVYKPTSPGNHTLYAHWKANTYTVTFNSNGGNAASPSSKSVTYDSTYGSLPSPTRNATESKPTNANYERHEYKFAGWYTAKTGGTQISSGTKYTTAGNITLYAHWSGRVGTRYYHAAVPATAGSYPSSVKVWHKAYNNTEQTNSSLSGTWAPNDHMTIVYNSSNGQVTATNTNDHNPQYWSVNDGGSRTVNAGSTDTVTVSKTGGSPGSAAWWDANWSYGSWS